MKFTPIKYFLLLQLLIVSMLVEAQKQDFIRIGPVYLERNDQNLKSLPYLKYDGKGIVDIRSATAQEKANANLYEKLITIDHEKKWYGAFWSFGDPSKSVVASFENNNDEIYVSEIKGRGFLVNGSAYVELADVLLDETNAHSYRYHVIKNDQEEIVPWKKPDQFIKTSDGKFSFAYLGKFSGGPGQQIKIEIYNTKNYADRSSILIEWVKIQTPIISGTIRYQVKQLRGIFDAGVIGINPDYKRNFPQYSLEKEAKRSNFVSTANAQHTIIYAADSLVDISLTTHNNPAVSTNVYLVKKENGKENRILIGGRQNKKVNIPRALWQEPGDYKIEFVPFAIVKRSDRANKTGMYEQEFPDKKFVYDLTVLPDKNQSIKVSISFIVFTAIALTLLVLFFMILSKYRSRLKFEKIQRRGEQAQSQLQSIRSQLNPHFIFNALSGIQTLMNKNEIDTANEYLSKFARLTRRVLDDADKDQVSLADEAALLDDYLKMEQLRFGFQYNITIDDKLSEDTLIPIMLLQPLVENAVKHGIVDKKKTVSLRSAFQKAVRT
ncbi:sensor histidine kinase [Niabella hibiscisoli]|uniref:sensor histidine kinase n=1 Tax=Niabella hibiscisoli TaxID=1825928 RepID=UPI001F115911|nr:histidine kinase [Niabella hibiscisoli]MCH5715802.1 histidine kinase [Niabella hibiscisoli]